MPRRKPLTDKNGEVRELTDEDFRQATTVDSLPASLKAKLKAVTRRGPQKAPTKELISIRLSRDVLAAYRSTGPGWQHRIDLTLKRSLARKFASR
ncbi:MAG: BrnA antitoxin family protein [Proteobacteria bacterium]|nr:BrnA antitoxin family protein [Pseudomonadota bacterium]